ncbi:hypothetical protein SNE40_001432 [Patella caerulea]|uniref:Uncharacterized protein n=1 Tax=Patella caerulea TaxID=87958 RepID=A0AAN8QB55_PATCE
MDDVITSSVTSAPGSAAPHSNDKAMDDVITLSATSAPGSGAPHSNDLPSGVQSKTKAACRSDLGGDVPAQPCVVNSPKTKFGKQICSFQSKWYTDRSWLEYSVQKDACFCFPCYF